MINRIVKSKAFKKKRRRRKVDEEEGRKYKKKQSRVKGVWECSGLIERTWEILNGAVTWVPTKTT